MTILLTGGLGFIGSHIAYSLLNHEQDVIILDSLINSDISTFYKLKRYFKNLTFVKGSLNDKQIVEKIFQNNHIDSVIHLAGLKAVGESQIYPAKYYYNNVLSSKILFELIKKYHVKNLIFSSSATVYGKPNYLPLNESHPITACNFYAQNKIDIENMLISDEFFNEICSVKILRYFNPIGAHHTGILGENPKGIPNNLMPYVLKVASGELPYVNVFGNDYKTHDGTGMRDYIHIMDLVEGHLNALTLSTSGVSIFNLGTGRAYSVLDIIKTFENVTKISIPFKFVKRRSGDVDAVYADPAKAKLALNFKTSHTLEQMCHDAWHFKTVNH
jgi:UDP-glucose 4-epimerase